MKSSAEVYHTRFFARDCYNFGSCSSPLDGERRFETPVNMPGALVEVW